MKRITLFCGHYGSGKTNIAVNYALSLRRSGKPTAIADVDIVNPYFRTKDSEALLREAGVEVISLPFANTNVDLPALPSELYALVQRRDRYAVFDVGGDDRGAYALGRYVPYILEENDYQMLFVTNFFRPLTPDAPSAMEVMREIEGACGIVCTGIVHNSNLGAQTAPEDILSVQGRAEELSRLSGLPLVMTSAEESLLPALEGRIPDLFPMRLQKRPID